MTLFSKSIILIWLFLISLSTALLAQQEETYSGNLIFEMSTMDGVEEREGNTIGQICDISGLDDTFIEIIGEEFKPRVFCIKKDRIFENFNSKHPYLVIIHIS